MLQDLLSESTITELVGVDVSTRMLEVASRRLRLNQMSERQRARFQLLHSSLTYLDPRLQGYDLAVLMEVLEHIDTPRLPAVEESLFGHARPKTVVVTTPNRAYNAHYEGLADGALRHRDHRFEWSRSEFGAWLERIGQRYGYLSERHEIGEVVASLGAPTQMAVLIRAETTPGKAEQRNVRSQ